MGFKAARTHNKVHEVPTGALHVRPESLLSNVVAGFHRCTEFRREFEYTGPLLRMPLIHVVAGDDNLEMIETHRPKHVQLRSMVGFMRRTRSK